MTDAYTRLCRTTATEMGKRHEGPLDLNNAVPFDIYELFERVTDRDYNYKSEYDELLILHIASDYEEAARED